MTTTRIRPLLITSAAILVIAGLVIGALAFQPWRLFTNVTVAEAAPVSAAEPRVLAEASFISHEHETTGTARIIELEDGSRVLRIEGLDTSNGPDLKVWLSDAPVIEGDAGWHVFDDGEYVDLGVLKGNQGDQNYAIPAGVDLDSLTSVAIWCDRFDVSFGAADLSA